MSRFYSESFEDKSKTTDDVDPNLPRLSKKFEEVCGKKEFTNEIITTRSPESLQRWFSAQRNRLESFLAKGEKSIAEATNAQQTYEKKFLQTYVDPIIEPAKKEDFAVGSGITIIGFLTGLIINKNVKQLRYIKPVMPLTLALVGFKLSLPQTFKSFADISYKVEGNIVSQEMLQKQAAVISEVKATEQKVINTADSVGKYIEEKNASVKNVVNKVLTFFS